MEKIASFTVDHLQLEPGIYVSRKDSDPATGGVATTFDLRMTAPNREPVMDTAPVHCIEHLGATYLRNHPEWRDKVLYFGPMGCRTGFYLIMFGDLAPNDVVGLIVDMYRFIESFEGEVPGAQPRDCGNYHDCDLPQAQWWARRYLRDTLDHIDDAHMEYPSL